MDQMMTWWNLTRFFGGMKIFLTNYQENECVNIICKKFLEIDFTEKILYRYIIKINNYLDTHIWIRFLHRYDHFVVKWANTWHIFCNEKNYSNLQVDKGHNLNSEIGLFLHHQKFCNLGRNTRNRKKHRNSKKLEYFRFSTRESKEKNNQVQNGCTRYPMFGCLTQISSKVRFRIRNQLNKAFLHFFPT